MSFRHNLSRDRTASGGSFPHDAVLECSYETSETASVVYESLSREVDEIADDRSRTTVEQWGPEDERLRLGVKARDLTSLRAALNTWCTLLDVAEAGVSIADGALDERSP